MTPDSISVRIFDIRRKCKRSRVGVASPHDFKLAFSGSRSLLSVNMQGIAYCVDLNRNEVLYTLSDDPGSLFYEPFLYAAQYDRAEQIAAVPLDSIDHLLLGCPARPIFVLSPGRCGSTLFAHVLRHSGVLTASEPDLMTQLASDQISGLDKERSDRLMRVCVASLATHCGAKLAVKLRSQCNALGADIARVFPDAKFLFILRDPTSWARSRFRAFGGDPRKLAHMYLGAVHSYDRLRSMGRKPLLIWYEDIVAQPVGVLKHLSAAGIPVTPPPREVISSIMRHDAQEGTHLASHRLGGREISPDEVIAFNDEWRRVRPKSDIQRTALERSE